MKFDSLLVLPQAQHVGSVPVIGMPAMTFKIPVGFARRICPQPGNVVLETVFYHSKYKDGIIVSLILHVFLHGKFGTLDGKTKYQIQRQDRKRLPIAKT